MHVLCFFDVATASILYKIVLASSCAELKQSLQSQCRAWACSALCLHQELPLVECSYVDCLAVKTPVHISRGFQLACHLVLQLVSHIDCEP